MIKCKNIFKHRFGPVVLIVLLVCTISFLTRLGLLIKSGYNIDLSILKIMGIFLIGFFYDLVVASFFAIPVALYCWLIKDSWYQKKWQSIPLFLLFFIEILILIFNAGGEFIFWNEFGVRYNFIAVDYLIYTNEVFENIWESYNIPLIISLVLFVVLIILFIIRKKIIDSTLVSMRFVMRSKYFLVIILIATCSYFLENNHIKNFSNNRFANELAGNGIYEFGYSFWNNQIDYNSFYATRKDTANFALIRKMLQSSNATFSQNPLSVERIIKNDSPLHKYNIVLISVESLSGEYLQHFGSTQKITPFLDSLIPHCLFFENFYASGTRTVRGLEALSLAIPPTPGQSIVRRPNNGDMFTMGNLLKTNGYDVSYIYGGNAFFDNMGKYFGGNGYRILDNRDIPKTASSVSTAWGLDDETVFDFMLTQCDKSYQSGKSFFNHMMTVSNHRPYDYPTGKIDISPTTKTYQGAVKYTDYAIHHFLKEAQNKPWFANTIFVIVADHCASSAGKTDLPVNRYHIPCYVYAPYILKPSIEQRYTSQIDLAPTLLGMLNLNYTSKFLGYDINKIPAGNERVFISTYQDMGYLKNGKLVVLSPQKKIKMYSNDFSTNKETEISTDDSLVNEAIAWYQSASYLYENKLYNK